MSMVSPLGHHAAAVIPPVGAQPASIVRRSYRVHQVGAAALLAAAALAAILLMQAVTAPVHVGPGPDLTESQTVVDNRPLVNADAVNCDALGNCLTP